MAYLGFGQVTDPQDPSLQPPANPDWLGRGDPAQRQSQQATQASLRALKAVSIGPAAGVAYTEAMQGIAVPGNLDDDERAALHHARSWIYAMTNAQIQAIYPMLPSAVIDRARELLWVPGLSAAAVHAQTITRYQEELPQLEKWAAEVGAMRSDLARYMDYVVGTFKQFETYMAWMKHHLAKKEHRTANTVKVITIIGEVAQWIPVVGWIIYAAAIVAEVGVQVNNARNAGAELNRAGFRGYILQNVANVYEATAQTMAAADNLHGQLQIAIAVRAEYLKHAGAFVPVIPGGVQAKRSNTGLLIGGGMVAAALAAFTLVRR